MASRGLFSASLSRLLLLSLSLSPIPRTAAFPSLSSLRPRAISLSSARSSYDFIIVGGGQSGLVIATRLTEDPAVSVLVVEFGYFDDSPAQVQPSSATKYLSKDMYNLTSAPQPGLGGSRQTVYAACVVGGGSAINGMMLNRGAADDYDNWERLGNKGWGFKNLLPYFVKSTMLQTPAPQLAEQFNITWDQEVYGTDGPIHVSFSPWQWPGITPQRQGLLEAGAELQYEGAGGRAHGLIWYTSAVDNTTVTRSYARTGYFDPARAARKNLDILTGWRVNEVLFDDDDGGGGGGGHGGAVGEKKAARSRAVGVSMQQRVGSTARGEIVRLKATKEVIVTAGSLHSPQVLQRSGIGPKWLLDRANVSVLVDLPGVGSNLQDHPVAGISFTYRKDLFPNPNTASTNVTFQQWVEDVWRINRRGPLAQTVGNTAGLIPLPLLSPSSYLSIVSTYLSQNASDFLPTTYTAAQLSGYLAQRALLASSMTRLDNAVMELPLPGAGSGPMLMTKEVSRGTVLLDPADVYAEPTIDYHTFANPVDARIMAENVRFARRWAATDAMRDAFDPLETSPGPAFVETDELVEAMRNKTSSSTAHISGSCSMMPRELGGVVDTELRVYGVRGLTVADSSIMPLIPGAHICSTVYAIAEKAADIIKARHKLAA